MTTTAMTSNLTAGLTTVTRAIKKQTRYGYGLPVLSNVRVSCSDGYIELQATDLEIGIRALVPAKTADMEPFTVNARDMLTFVKSAPKDGLVHITIETEPIKGARLTSAASSITLPIIDAEEFPIVPFASDEPDRYGYVDGPTFARACKRAFVTAASDETRPILTGALMRFTESGLVIVSADNYRISETVVPWQVPPTPDVIDQTHIVVARALNVWAALKADRVMLNVRPNASQVILTADGVAMVARMIDGQFPNYESVIPLYSMAATVSTFDVAPVAAALASVLPTAKRSANVVRVAVNGAWELSAACDGQTAEASAAVATTGDDLTIALNGTYLKDALASLGKEASAYLQGPLTPMLLCSRDAGDAYRIIVMPVRMPS